MRDTYYNFINEQNFNDNLSDISELSYSQKIIILKELQIDFDNSTICLALNDYHQRYIKKNRVRIKLLYNTLKGICQRELQNARTTK